MYITVLIIFLFKCRPRTNIRSRPGRLRILVEDRPSSPPQTEPAPDTAPETAPEAAPEPSI